jgi:hypothetical protein
VAAAAGLASCVHVNCLPNTGCGTVETTMPPAALLCTPCCCRWGRVHTAPGCLPAHSIGSSSQQRWARDCHQRWRRAQPGRSAAQLDPACSSPGHAAPGRRPRRLARQLLGGFECRDSAVTGWAGAQPWSRQRDACPCSSHAACSAGAATAAGAADAAGASGAGPADAPGAHAAAVAHTR